MTTADGTVVGTTRVVDNGPAAERWNMVVMGDGYRANQLGQFAADTQQFVTTMLATPPFVTLRRAINVFRVDVTSTDSGADDPAACGGTGAKARTYFDASFCTGGIQRLLVVDNTTALTVAAAQVPQFHMAMVLVNSQVYGGSGGAVAVFSLAPGASEIGLHEMGHTAFGLADEYEFWAGCGVDTDRDRHPAYEPFEPNVSIYGDRARNKWRRMVAAATPMPTTRNADCRQCDPQPNPVAPETVGAFEGAHYYHCGAFRPTYMCRMRALFAPFCPVCRSEIERVLRPFMPQPAAVVRPFAPEQTLAGGCVDALGGGDAVVTAGGTVLGFATCPSPSGEPIRFFRRAPDGTVSPSESTGFAGRVLAVAYDAEATYVLFVSGDDLRVGRRTHAGAFSSRVVDSGFAAPATATATATATPTAAVVARDGAWFGVWSKPGPDGRSRLACGGSALPVGPVTQLPAGRSDGEPTLAYSASTPVLLWSRSEVSTGASDLRVAKYVSGAWQDERVFTSDGTVNAQPHVHIAGGVTFVAWARDGFVRVASNPTGSFTSRMFNTGGSGPRVATSLTGGVVDHAFVSWTSAAEGRVFFAESATSGGVTGTWAGTHLGPAGSRALATGGFATKGTAVYRTAGAVAARTQR